MIVAGLTGSIAMGKSETAKMFAALGVPVFDADAEVHRLYSGDVRTIGVVAREFPGSVVSGKIDRERLAEVVLADPAAMKRLEAAVHPIIGERQAEFVERARRANEKLVVLDLPLLFETGAAARVDRIVVVSAPLAVQRERALARKGMTPERFESILAKQLDDAGKRARADYIVDSSQGLNKAFEQVKAIVADLLRQAGTDS